jgi:hypothetical protein
MPSTLDAICLISIGPAFTSVRRRSFPDFAVPDFLANRNMTDERIDSGPILESIRSGLEAKTAVSGAAKNHCLKPERGADAPVVEINS